MLASTVIAIALTVLVGGWALDIAVLRSVLPGAVGMKATTASGLICAGASLLLLQPPGAGVRRRVAGLAAGLAPGLFGVLVLAEYVFGWSLGIDELGFVDHAGRAHGIAYPGRLAPATAVCFVLVGLMVALLELPPRRGWRPSELVAVPVAVVVLMSLVGYAYSITVFYGPASAAKMAVNAAVCFVLLVVGFALVRPHGRLLRLATTTEPGGVMIRRLAPLVLTVPFGLGWLHLRTVQWGVFDDEAAAWWLSASTMLGLMLMIARCAAALSRGDVDRKLLEAELYELASHDQLTGLCNRHRYEEELRRFTAHHLRYGDPGAVVLLDLDNLKQVNDELGHQTGDRLLRAVSDALTARLRVTDFLARLGGDEFAVLLPRTSPCDARMVADDLLAAVRTVQIDARGATAGTTASAGIARLGSDIATDPGHLMDLADEAMYVAKRAGGDRVAEAAIPSVPAA
ncbi:MAG: diguanylate cyclase [Solirubrobacterales bacterium]|nr:diguanylate cyclase [Solirubrobacterales bacterium]